MAARSASRSTKAATRRRRARRVHSACSCGAAITSTTCRNIPSKLLPIFEDAKKEVDRSKRGSIEIHSDPAAAQAYVDGRFVGVTPTSGHEGLTVGERTSLTLKKEGFHKAVQPVTVSAKVQGGAEMKLERSAKFLLVEEALKGRRATARPRRLRSRTSVDSLKEVLYLDQAVFVPEPRRQRAEQRIRIDSYLYDLRSHRRLSSETPRDQRRRRRKSSLAKEAASLYVNVKYDAESWKPPPTSRSRSRSPRARPSTSALVVLDGPRRRRHRSVGTTSRPACSRRSTSRKTAAARAIPCFGFTFLVERAAARALPDLPSTPRLAKGSPKVFWGRALDVFLSSTRSSADGCGVSNSLRRQRALEAGTGNPG